MAQSVWSDQNYKQFALIYEKYPCLWNTKSDNYNNAIAKMIALRDIVRDMKDAYEIETTEKDVKIKIVLLRGTYIDELQKISAGTSSLEAVKSRHAWFTILDRFLREHVNISLPKDSPSTSAGKCNLQNNNQGINSLLFSPDVIDVDALEHFNYNDLLTTNFGYFSGKPSTSNCSTSTVQTQSVGRKRTTTNNGKKITTPEKQPRTLSKQDEFDDFGKQIASQLRAMDKINAIDVQNQIYTLISNSRIQTLLEQKK